MDDGRRRRRRRRRRHSGVLVVRMKKSASWKEFREDALTFKDDELEFLSTAPWFEMSNDKKKKKKKSLLERWLDVGKESRSSSNSSSNSEDESRYMPERSVY